MQRKRRNMSMKNEKIAKVLKESRKRNRLSVGMLSRVWPTIPAKSRKKRSMAWESGQAQPECRHSSSAL